jgi:hypothetical protein
LAFRRRVYDGNSNPDKTYYVRITNAVGNQSHTLPEALAYHKHKKTVIDRVDAPTSENAGVAVDAGDDRRGGVGLAMRVSFGLGAEPEVTAWSSFRNSAIGFR